MNFEISPYIVYVNTNDSGYITDVNSSAFLHDTTGWMEIDRGYGDKYHHAQGNYFPKPIFTDGGAYRYKLVDGETVECSAEEIAEKETADQQGIPVSALEGRVDILESDSAEMKEVLYMILSGVSE